MTTSPRRSLPLLLVVLVLLLAACGAAPDRSEPRQPSPTGSPEAMAGALPDPGATARITWRLQQRTLADGRTYFVGVPACIGSLGCEAWLAYPRKLIISLHGAMQVEDAANAQAVIRGISSLTGGDAVPVFAVSRGGTRLWDADLCCTDGPVDETRYLKDVIADVGKLTPIDPERVGLVGVSNGGMLATKAICTHPEDFKAVAIWAGSWRGSCNRGPVVIGHWHGTGDTTVPIDGGTTAVLGRPVTFPPAGWLKGRLAKGSTFKFVAVPGAPHWPAPAATASTLLTWLDRHL